MVTGGGLKEGFDVGLYLVSQMFSLGGVFAVFHEVLQWLVNICPSSRFYSPLTGTIYGD